MRLAGFLTLMGDSTVCGNLSFQFGSCKYYVETWVTSCISHEIVFTNADGSIGIPREFVAAVMATGLQTMFL